MKDTRYVFNENIVPLTAPVDGAGTAFATPFVDLKNALHATFFAYFGVVTSTSTDQSVTVTMLAATSAATTGETAIAFNYRLSGATGANSWGASTAATATGVAVTTTDDAKMLAVDINPAALEGALADARFVKMNVGIDAGGTVTLASAWAVLEPRYSQSTHLSAT